MSKMKKEKFTTVGFYMGISLVAIKCMRYFQKKDKKNCPINKFSVADISKNKGAKLKLVYVNVMIRCNKNT